MEPQRLIEALVTAIAPNASLAAFEERDTRYRVTLVGTTGVLANCDIPRAAVDAAERESRARARVTAVLKRCADDVVAPVPDGRA